MAFSPDGRLAASGSGGLFVPAGRTWVPSDDYTVRLWNVETGKELRQFVGHEEQVTGLAFSPNGKLLASSGSLGAAPSAPDKGSVRVWDVATGKQLLCLRGDTAKVKRVAFLPDGRRLICAGYDGRLRLWDVETGKEIRSFVGHQGFISGVAISPDGRRALSGGADGTVRLWNVDNGEELRRFEGHTGSIQWVCFSPDGSRGLSCGLDGSIRLWDIETGKQLRQFDGHTDFVNGVVFSPDGRRAVSCSFDGSVRVWDVETGKELDRFTDHTAPVFSIAMSPDGRYALTGSNDKTMRLWRLRDPSSAEKVGEVRRFLGFAPGWVTAAEFSRDGRRVVAVAQELRVWNATTGEILGAMGNLHCFGWGLAVAPDGKTAYQSSDKGVVRIYDLEKANEVGHFDALGQGPSVLELSAGGKRLLISVVHVWKHRLVEVPSGNELARFEGGPAALSPDGTRVALLKGKRIVLLDVASGKEVGSFDSNQKGPGNLRFTQDGRSLVVSGPGNNAVGIWDVSAGKERCRLTVPDVAADTFVRLGVSPDGRRILTGLNPNSPGRNPPIILWDGDTAKEVCRFSGPEEGIFTLAFSPDGRTAIATGDDGTVRLLQLPDMPAAKNQP